MKKSDLKKQILEALTPDEAALANQKYKEIYINGMLQDNPLKLSKYDNPDQIGAGRSVSLAKKTSNQPPSKEEKSLEEIDNFIEKSGKNIADINMEKYKEGNMKENRLNEFVKTALMGPIDEGNAFAVAVQQAKEDGKKPGDKFTVDGKEYTLKKEHLGEVENPTIPDTSIKKVNLQVKDAPTMAKAMLDFYNRVKAGEKVNFSTNSVFKALVPKLQNLARLEEAERAIANITGNPLDTVEFDVATSSEIDEITSQIVGDLMSVGALKSKKLANDAYYTIKSTIDKFIDNMVVPNVEKGIQKAKPDTNNLSERILKELRGSINEMAGEDLELKSLAKKMIPIFKKYGMRVDYKTDTKSIEMKPKVNAGNVPATLIISKQDDGKGGFGMLTVAVYWLSLVSAKNDKRLGLQELDMGSGPSKQDYKDADEMANKIYKELMAVVPKGEFDSIAPPKMNKWGNYLIHFRLKK